jgi:two-component system, LuxR family, sensor kinase FixL
MIKMNHLSQNKIKWLGVLCLAVIFAVDAETPLGIADAMTYIAVVLLTIWIPGGRSTLYFGIAGIVLTIAGFFLSPSGEAMNIAITNRILAIIGISVAIVVVRKFKIAQDEIVFQKESLDSLFNHAAEGIIFTDEHGNILMSNPKVQKIFGFSPEAFNGINIMSFFTIESSYEIMEFWEYARERELSFETTGLAKNGVEFPVKISFSSFDQRGQKRYVVFIQDITQRKKQEQILIKAHDELSIYTQKLNESNAELENFAYIASHDLQEPLRKIQSFGSRLAAKLNGKLEQPEADDLSRVIKASNRMQVMINDLLTLSRVRTQQKPFEKTDLNLLLNEVIDDIEIAIKQSGAKITVENLPVVEADPVQMRQVFQNLITNAIKFGKEGTVPEIIISSALALDNEKEMYEIKVADNGIGFDNKYSSKIFDIFQRLNGAAYEGSGIGLSVCKKIILRHGGNISTLSNPGHGTTFTIKLPVLSQTVSESMQYISQN